MAKSLPKKKQKKRAGHKAPTSKSLTPEQAVRVQRQRIFAAEEIRLFVTRLLAMVILLAVLFGVIFGVTPMANNDMSPRISAGDLMLYYRLEHSYVSQDVVVLKKDGAQYTGRIIARGGDVVEITKDSELMVNGSVVLENDIYYRTPQYESELSYPVTLGEDQYFVLGDYREGAKDSRYFGPVNADEIKGKVITVIRRSGL